MIGKTLAHYTVLEKIGEGGMGEVFRARDTTLDRDVALKVLPSHLTADPERIARFEREAKVLASLNHSSIAGVYGFHEQDGVRFLAMELVEGPDLSQRLSGQPLPIDELLPLAAHLAEAMEYAHERGIVHRDLKPANIKLAQGGGIKVLDFGLAKAFAMEDASGNPTSSPTMLPTITSGHTVPGMIMGTAAYMSPEQARGQMVDRRTDIWAFGCVLYEMLTGKLLFEGSTVSDTLAAVLRQDLDFAELPADIPASVRFLLERCLDRNPKTRLRDIGEARVVLADPQASTAMRIVAAADTSVEPARRLWLLPLVAVLALAVGLLAGRFLAPTVSDYSEPALLLAVQDTSHVPVAGSVALSPSGEYLVYSAKDDAGTQELWLRRLNEESSRRITGSRGAKYPFWSPDENDIGFFVGSSILKTSVKGGSPLQVAVLKDTPLGGTWSTRGVMLVGTHSGPLYRVAAGGGTPVEETTVDPTADAHVWPTFFPDGNHYLYLVDASSTDGHKLAVGSLDDDAVHIVRTGVRSQPFLDPAGAILFVDAAHLVALPFDLKKLKVTGDPIPAQEDMLPAGLRHEVGFTLSQYGPMAFQRAANSATLIRAALDGSTTITLAPRGGYRNPRVSNDGRKAAFEVEVSNSERVIWVEDLERGGRSLISPQGTTADGATWSPDGEWIYFGMGLSGGEGDIWQIYRKRVLGGGPPEFLGSPIPNTATDMHDVSPDGSRLLVNSTVEGKLDLFLGFWEGDSLRWSNWSKTSDGQENNPRFSRDGRWIAYESDVSGHSEIYLSPLEGGPAYRQFMVSVGGGTDPAFSPDGNILYYRDTENMLMAVSIRLSESNVEAGTPKPLISVAPPSVGYLRNAYDILPNGNEIIAFVASEREETTIRVRTAWRQW